MKKNNFFSILLIVFKPFDFLFIFILQFEMLKIVRMSRINFKLKILIKFKNGYNNLISLI